VDKGYVLEGYNHGGANGFYGGVGISQSTDGRRAGKTSVSDRAQVRGFQGPESAMAAIMQYFLGFDLAQKVTDD
jgi:hypothetical protein